MQRIFLVEDDESIRDMTAYAFSAAGFEVESFGDANTFRKRLEEQTPSLVLLDIMLPEEDGISILKKLRGAPATKALPVILLTAKGSEYDRIKGLDCGADDYITKPFSVMEAISRVRAVLRRCEESKPDGFFCIGDITLDVAKRTVSVGGRKAELTYKEFELLQYLMENRDIVLTRERLLDKIWGYDYGGESRTLDIHIRTLRKKLGEAGEQIVTIRNVGYKIGGKS